LAVDRILRPVLAVEVSTFCQAIPKGDIIGLSIGGSPESCPRFVESKAQAAAKRGPLRFDRLWIRQSNMLDCSCQ